MLPTRTPWAGIGVASVLSLDCKILLSICEKQWEDDNVTKGNRFLNHKA